MLVSCLLGYANAIQQQTHTEGASIAHDSDVAEAAAVRSHVNPVGRSSRDKFVVDIVPVFAVVGYIHGHVAEVSAWIRAAVDFDVSSAHRFLI
jgi:hypothetical protein